MCSVSHKILEKTFTIWRIGIHISVYSAGQRAQNRVKPEIVSQKIGISKKFIPRLEILTTNLYI